MNPHASLLLAVCREIVRRNRPDRAQLVDKARGVLGAYALINYFGRTGTCRRLLVIVDEAGYYEDFVRGMGGGDK